MSHELALLLATAATVGFLHTVMGPDHYLPFIVLARARRWSRSKTALVTVACGIGHVGSSVVLGLLGIALGLTLSRVEAVEAVRGDVAAWLLIILGLLYCAWGLRRAATRRPHVHPGLPGSHNHGHPGDHAHGRDHGALGASQPGQDAAAPAQGQGATPGQASGISVTPWALFIVFVLGPCEPLIPILMYPAATSGLAEAAVVAGVFGAVTLATMLGAVALGTMGVDLLPLGHLERYSHALAGAAIALSGLGIQLLGL